MSAIERRISALEKERTTPAEWRHLYLYVVDGVTLSWTLDGVTTDGEPPARLLEDDHMMITADNLGPDAF